MNRKSITRGIKKITQKLKTKDWLLILAVCVSLAVKLVNLNYNSPFNDEAIYVVVGRMGLFYKDWTTLEPLTWVGGLPYFYPSLAAVLYQVGGIVLDRLANVVMFTLLLVLIHKTAGLIFDEKITQRKSQITSLILLAAAPIGYHVARIATYDMPSILLTALGFYFLLLAQKTWRHPGEYYFKSSLVFILAFLFKYIAAIYIPLAVVYSFFLGASRK